MCSLLKTFDLNGCDTKRFKSQRPTFVTEFLIDDDELGLNILLLRCFLSSRFKIGFSTRSEHNFDRKGKVFRVYSKKPPMRDKKYGYDEPFQYNVYIPDTPCVDYDNNWWTDIIDRMQRHDQMFLPDSCIFPSKLNPVVSCTSESNHQ